jgi:hypothetical protein
MAGMDEAVSFRVYQLAGVPSPDTHWVHFRVIDAAEETSTRNQYGGDLWGLYLVVQEKNGTWLRECGLPEGNIHSPETGPKHIARARRQTGRIGENFRRRPGGSSRKRGGARTLTCRLTIASMRSTAWSRTSICARANHYFYHRPDGHWVALPHDLDMMFIAKTHWPGIIDQARCLDIPALQLEYQNRAREILDLFCSDAAPNGGQIGQLVAELSDVLCPAGQERTWPELDLAMWNFHPRSNARGQFYLTPCDDNRMGGSWRRTLATPDFRGFCRYITEFCTDSRPVKNYKPNDGDQRGYGFGFLGWEAGDDKVPARPTIRYTGSPGLAPDQLTFEVSPFVLPGASPFAAAQWRVGEISAPGLAGYHSGEPCRYEIQPHWASGELKAEETTLLLPKTVCQRGHTYRVRARYQDETGRWSHWSEPIQFVAGQPAVKVERIP